MRAGREVLRAAAAQAACREEPTRLGTVRSARGWLNACAFYRVQREAHHEGDMEGQETGGRASGSPSNVQGGPDR
eukprot:scaffold38171_cov50-Phaeocystis_antarctica.AAC.2